MTRRRLAAALLAFAGLAPAALASGLTLHVAFDHAPVAAADPADRATAVARGELERLGQPGEHDHEIGAPADLLARTAAAPAVAAGPAAAEPGGAAATPKPSLAAAAPPGPPPPRAAGPPLLALLSILRV